jgi:hypothetical protein
MAAPSRAESGFLCSTSGTSFATYEELKAHMQSELHR